MKNLKLYILGMFLWISQPLSSQVYVEKQTRHRFAQMNYGKDVQANFGGETFFLNPEGAIEKLNLKSFAIPRLLIGGTHFWGHADFVIAIPVLSPTDESSNQIISTLAGVETIFKLYPSKIVHNKLRPYVGVAFTDYYHEQENKNLAFGNGPDQHKASFPLLGGVSFNSKDHLFDLGFTWNYNNTQDYYISQTDVAQVKTSPLFFNLSYRRMLDTTLGGEKNWESGATKKRVDALAAKGLLNAFYVGVGMSTASWIGSNSYNESNRPYVQDYGISSMPEFSVGYYLHKPDLNFNISYRGYSFNPSTYGAEQSANRKAFSFEITKAVADYHGFVPFIGPVVSYEMLSFSESYEDQEIHNLKKKDFGYGLAFGWDIRPDRLQAFTLRTNMRWFPKLNLEVENGKSISFSSFEFNFIELIVYPGRMF